MAATLKTEDGPPIITKTEPDAESSAHFMDDDDGYEDTGELEMPKELTKAWLTKISKPLYENWAAIDDDEPVQLGVVRRFKSSGKYRLVLHSASKYNSRVPLEYDMRMQDPSTANTYVFSEKDLPEYKSKSKVRKNTLGPQSQGGVKKDDKYRPWRRRVVPKQTALAASVGSEVTCFALENEEYRRIMAQRMADDQASKPGIELLVGDARLYGAAVLPSEGKVSRPNAYRAAGGFDSFVKTAAPPKAKVQENKASRIPHNDLLDLIFDCFKEYRYWSMKALRGRINQPHDYLRSTVAEVADLVRSGPFYGLYTLKKDFEHKVPEPKEDQEAPKKEGDSSEGEDYEDIDEDDVEMEDVYPT